MHSARILFVLVVGFVGVVGTVPACGGKGVTIGPPGSNDSAGGAPGSGTLGGPEGLADGGTGSSGGRQAACPPGLTCNVSCSGGGTTSISGTVYDPAGKNPLYNVSVYVPATSLVPLPKGVPTGADACSCDALYKSGATTSATTAVDGTFTLKNVPVGSQVPLVLQVGKWRRATTVKVNACTDNAQPNHSLTLPGAVAAGDTEDSIPDIAVSTGSADSLECLMRRIGLAPSEYVAGAGTTGHVHIFAGGESVSQILGGFDGGFDGGFGGFSFDGGIGFGSSTVGSAEEPPMSGAPPSYSDLWSTKDQLMPYDLVLLSCEGGETYKANPPALEAYLNAGGRAFASHFHYSWFSGPLDSQQGYAAPSDWGNHLATWSAGASIIDSAIGGTIDQTLNETSNAFPKGVALDQWLKNVDALGQDGVPAGELSIYQPRYNAVVGSTNTASQPWITSGGSTMYFSFDTPISNGSAPTPDGTGPTYCGRAVFSDVHVAGNPTTRDTSPPPGGCDDTELSPQEKALEFMLFDLSSCVIPDTVAPPDAGVVPAMAQ